MMIIQPEQCMPIGFIIREKVPLINGIFTVELQKEENDLKKKVKVYEDNERVLQDKVKVLGDKKHKNKELLNNKRKLINSNSNNNAMSSNVNVNSNDLSGLEMKIKDLQNQINMIEDKKRERNNTINSFFAEMNVLLQEHEQKCKTYFI